MNFTYSSLKLFLGNIASAGIQFLGITYFARELGASEMGVFFLFQALLGMFAVPADFGLRGAVEKRISEGESQRIFLSSALALKLVPITVIILGILFLRPFINSYLGKELATLLTITILLQEGAQMSVFVLKGELRVGETAVLKFAREIIWVVIGVFLVNQGLEAKALIYSLAVGLAVMLMWGWYKSSVSPGRPSKEHAFSLFEYGKYNMVSSIGGYFYNWMDVAIIGLFLTQAHVGAYEAAWRVTAVVMLLSKSIASTLFPQVSRWNAEDAVMRIESTIHETITPSMALVIPAFFGTVLLSNKILHFVFGPEFTIAWFVMIILMGEKVLQSVHIILGRALQGVNRPDLAARAGIIAILTNILLSLILVFYYGIVGAAIATVISFTINSFLHAYYLSQFISIRLPYTQLAGLTVASIGMSVVLFYVQSIAEINTMARLITFILFGGLIYFMSILLIPSLRQRFINLLNGIMLEFYRNNYNS